MKVLLTCQPGHGHFHPLVPLAQALQAAGHQPVVATSPSFGPWVREAGLTAIPVGMDWLESAPELADAAVTGDPTDCQELGRLLEAAFLLAARSLLPDLQRIVVSWHPDLVVHESDEFLAPLVAEACDVPSVCVGIGHRQPLAVFSDWAEGPWSRARVKLGLPPDPDLTRLWPYLYLDAYPPSLHPQPIDQVLDVAHGLRPPSHEVGGGPVPSWLERLPDGPLIYVTMGTIFNRVAGVFHRILDAVSGLPWTTVVVTVGSNVDPATLGAPPAHVHVERYVPQAAILRRAQVVVSHAGYNTVAGALAHAVPMVCLPLGADQHYNAFRLAACGAGLQLDWRSATAATIRQTIETALDDDLYRRNARRLQTEVAAMPDPMVAVGLLERLAASRQPIYRPSGDGSAQPDSSGHHHCSVSTPGGEAR